MKIILILLLFPFCSKMTDNSVKGKYEYQSGLYHEMINLFDDNTFTYSVKDEFLKYEIRGNFCLKGDSLILNSYPHKDKIIVREKKRGANSNLTIIVTDKMNYPLNYTLKLIKEDNSITEIKNQWNRSKTAIKNVKSFYIIDNKGLKSPIYTIQGKSTNYFEVQFETQRIFENEKWCIIDNKIRPLSLGGEYQNYYLEKNK